jgi:hypothetical protein
MISDVITPMRYLLALLFLFSPLTLRAQSLPEWQRVYTFDESTVEMNTALVTKPDRNTVRLRFRWVFDNPEPLVGAPALKYQSQLDVMEFKCSSSKYRSYHVTFFDSAGNTLRIQDSPGEWRTVVAGSMIEKLFVPGCELVTVKPRSEESQRLEKAAEYAFDVARQLEHAKDFKTVIDKFFVPEYLRGYLLDERTNWFFNLNRDTAATVTRNELERFYVAMMNAEYLTSLYLISQFPSEPSSVEKLLPPDVLLLLDKHPYTTRYKTGSGKYDFLGETIEGVERLRSYTDLLEKISSLMRKHVKTVKAEQSTSWKEILDHWDLYQPKLRLCGSSCLGLPKDTKLIEVSVPVFNLQLAEVDGNLKIFSAKSRF